MKLISQQRKQIDCLCAINIRITITVVFMVLRMDTFYNI